jgi:hypothetical protein
MRFSAGTVANAAAWAVIIGLVAVAFGFVAILGPFGLAVLGLLTLFICTQFQLHENTPTGGTEVFRAGMASHGSPEQRAAMLEDQRPALSALRLFRWCGIVLLVAGVAGFAWQQLR